MPPQAAEVGPAPPPPRGQRPPPPGHGGSREGHWSGPRPPPQPLSTSRDGGTPVCPLWRRGPAGLPWVPHWDLPGAQGGPPLGERRLQGGPAPPGPARAPRGAAPHPGSPGAPARLQAPGSTWRQGHHHPQRGLPRGPRSQVGEARTPLPKGSLSSPPLPRAGVGSEKASRAGVKRGPQVRQAGLLPTRGNGGGEHAGAPQLTATLPAAEGRCPGPPPPTREPPSRTCGTRCEYFLPPGWRAGVLPGLLLGTQL